MIMSTIADEVATYLSSQLAAMAKPEDGKIMAAYMKTEMPFYGVKKPARAKLASQVKKQFSITRAADYEAMVKTLWRLPHREEKYLAITLARKYSKFIVPSRISLYKSMIRQGAWWDLVDEIATHLSGRLWLTHRDEIAPLMDDWIKDDDLWIRRAAIIGQARHKEETDWQRLSRYCKSQFDDKEFFIRKAIGWALREYSYHQPQRVLKYLNRHQQQMSPLSYREGIKGLKRLGYV